MKTIQEIITSDEYRHVPTGILARLGQRLGKVFASPTTWYRLVRRFRWRRPRKRIHPSRPKVGIRASRPNEIWHVDTTLIRLLDGSRAYLHAVIDNFSRRILAWKVSATFDPSATAELLLNASNGLVGQKPTLLSDGGVENFNGAVDRLAESGLLKRLLAMTEITFSNSLIESWWRALKHQWLYLNTLDTVSTLETLVGFYVDEHNTRLPHPRSVARRRTRCTSAPAVTSPSNWPWPGKSRVRPEWKRTARDRARNASNSCRSRPDPGPQSLTTQKPSCGETPRGDGEPTIQPTGNDAQTTHGQAHLHRPGPADMASGGENSRRKLQNVVANSSA